MIKFGSRMDVIVPENSLIKVSVNEKVTGGETIIAEVIAA
jgi:phosphatidylserine decarboxylase